MTGGMGWRTDDTVALIRGTADSVVVLDAARRDPRWQAQTGVTIRKTISLAEQAKSSIQSVVDGGVTSRIGVISLPSFYSDLAARQQGVGITRARPAMWPFAEEMRKRRSTAC
jgi:carboxyl-terminal processing protease